MEIFMTLWIFGMLAECLKGRSTGEDLPIDQILQVSNRGHEQNKKLHTVAHGRAQKHKGATSTGEFTLVETDMMLNEDQWKRKERHKGRRRKRKAVTEDEYLWSDGVLPFHVTPGFSTEDLKEMNAAMDEWTEYTCLTFRPASDWDVSYIIWVNGDSCWSELGRQPEYPQPISLAKNCRQKRIIIHEIGHAVGFIHEHNRADRGEYVNILYENVDDEGMDQFDMESADFAQAYGVPYDYYSIMHYGQHYYSKNGNPTIETKDPRFQDKIGKAEGLSFYDIKLANIVYKCNSHCPPRLVPCPPSGFLGKDCECWCPGPLPGKNSKGPVKCDRVGSCDKSMQDQDLHPNAVSNGNSASKNPGVAAGVRCSELKAPENGSLLGGCKTTCGQVCRFACNAGHVIQGSEYTICTDKGWSEVPPRCVGCPENTYKLADNSRICMPCPWYSHTTGGPGTSQLDCHCDVGFTGEPGDPCDDIDECMRDNGGCNQVCHNMIGSYMCGCNQTGYVLDIDTKTCLVRDKCPQLHTADYPDNGWIVCRHFNRTNGDFCHIKCSPGYFYVSGENNYISCGLDTHYQWSHRINTPDARIPACTRGFSVDTQTEMGLELEGSVNCTQVYLLIAPFKDHMINNILGLEACHGFCSLLNMTSSCEDSNIDDHSLSEIYLNFKVLLRNRNENAVDPSCNSRCRWQNLREMVNSTRQLRNAIRYLLRNGSMQTEQPSPFKVIPFSFHTGRPHILCDEGQVLVSRRLCVPCDVGHYLPERHLGECLPCPLATYQDEQGQTDCKPCYPGSTTLNRGATHPTECVLNSM